MLAAGGLRSLSSHAHVALVEGAKIQYGFYGFSCVSWEGVCIHGVLCEVSKKPDDITGEYFPAAALFHFGLPLTSRL
jgi:hypothetical protein